MYTHNAMRTRVEAEAHDESDRKILQDIARYGWHIIQILPEGNTPGWTFSIGLFTTLKHPEIVVFGLDNSVAHALVNEVGGRVRLGERFSDRTEADGLLEGVTCIFRKVQTRWYRPFLGSAMWYYFGSEFPVLQCIWPDHEQLYPWHAGFRESWIGAEPLLYEETPSKARVVELLLSLGEQS